MEQCSNDTNGCLNLTDEQYRTMFFSMVGLFSLSFFLSCVAVLMLLVISGPKVLVPCSTTNVSSILQLTLYILLSVFFYNGAELMKAIPSSLDCSGWEIAIKGKLCQASGFLLEYFALVTYLLAFLTTLYMGRHIFGCTCTWKYLPMPLIILLVGVITPLLIAWIPFVTNNYRLAGAWCWIAVHTKECKPDKIGLSEEIALYYVFVFAFSFIMFIMAVIILCSLCGCCCLKTPTSVNEQQQAGVRKSQLEFIPLLVYPIVFTTFFCIDVTQRILFAVSPKEVFSLWMVHAIGGNTACLLVPLAFIIHPLNLSRFYQRLKRKRKRDQPPTLSEADPLIQSCSRDYQTAHIVPPSTSGDDPLIIQEKYSVDIT